MGYPVHSNDDTHLNSIFNVFPASLIACISTLWLALIISCHSLVITSIISISHTLTGTGPLFVSLCTLFLPISLLLPRCLPGALCCSSLPLCLLFSDYEDLVIALTTTRLRVGAFLHMLPLACMSVVSHCIIAVYWYA